MKMNILVLKKSDWLIRTECVLSDPLIRHRHNRNVDFTRFRQREPSRTVTLCNLAKNHRRYVQLMA